MAAPSPRRFTLLDAVILVGATAVAIAWSRTFVARLNGPPRFSDPDLWGYAVEVLAASLPFSLLWTGALAALRLRNPRPLRRHLARQPGTAACAAVIAASAIVVLVFLILLLLDSIGLVDRMEVATLPLFMVEFAGSPHWSTVVSTPDRMQEIPYGLLVLAAPELGLSVAITWLTQIANRRWRPERSWIDRAGRVLGLYWMCVGTIFGIVWFAHLKA
jgi:hypothetical protein